MDNPQLEAADVSDLDIDTFLWEYRQAMKNRKWPDGYTKRTAIEYFSQYGDQAIYVCYHKLFEIATERMLQYSPHHEPLPF